MRIRVFVGTLLVALAVGGPAAAMGFLDSLFAPMAPVSPPKGSRQAAPPPVPPAFLFGGSGFGAPQQYSNRPLYPDEVSPYRLVPFEFQRQTVSYASREAPGTVVIDTKSHFLYLVLGNGQAVRYGVGVGREGFGWKGTVRIGNKAEWPGWTPPPQMIARERARGHYLPPYMAGGPDNPLGARALYLFGSEGDTGYRIHGTSEPWTIGLNVSSGCIRLNNDDVTDLYQRVPMGAKVIVM